MKTPKTIAFLAMGLLMGLLVVSGSAAAASSDDKASMDDIKKETNDLIQSLKRYSADQRDEAVQEAKAALARIDQRIDALETQIDGKWDQMSQSVRERTRDSLRALHKQRNEAAQWYGSLKTSSAGAWKDMKQGFSDAYQKLSEAWERSRQAFGESN